MAIRARRRCLQANIEAILSLTWVVAHQWYGFVVFELVDDKTRRSKKARKHLHDPTFQTKANKSIVLLTDGIKTWFRILPLGVYVLTSQL